MTGSYFARLSDDLSKARIDTPRLVIDRARLLTNRNAITAKLKGRALRLVVKSLPCPALLAAVSRVDQTPRFMVFHRPFLQQIVRAFPQADVVLGKPMPLAALERFYGDGVTSGFDPTVQLTWLVDTLDRLLQYLAFAKARSLRLRVAIEIDVGLHRGGVPEPRALDALLDAIVKAPEQLSFVGFMGYDAHAAKAPAKTRAVRAAARRYSEFVAWAKLRLGEAFPRTPLLNGAGSATFALHDHDSPINDVALGSALLKPTDFELPGLEDLSPAAWIATPVLKRERGVRVPFLEWLPSLRRDAVCLYGGKWMARPAWPLGMRPSRLFGSSSNQQVMSVPQRTPLAVDEFVFFRPTQSESVLLGFGDLLAWDGGGSFEAWPVLEQTP